MNLPRHSSIRNKDTIKPDVSKQPERDVHESKEAIISLTTSECGKTSSDGGTAYTIKRDGIASETSLCSWPVFKETKKQTTTKKKSWDHMITLDI